MTILRLRYRDADDRGYQVPAQTDLLGPVQQVGLEPVEIEPQIAEQDEAGADIKRVDGGLGSIAGRVDHRAQRPDILHRESKRFPAVSPIACRIPGGQPEARVIHDVRVWNLGRVDDGRTLSGMRCWNAVRFIREHG